MQWTYPLKDESRRSYVGHLRSPMTEDQCSAWFKIVVEGTEWQKLMASSGGVSRKTAWLVEPGCSCAYRYGVFHVNGKQFPPWMLEMMEITMPHFNLMHRSQWPNSCNLNLYDDGTSSVGWHADDEQLFNAKHQDVRILSLSLGVPRKF